MKRKGVIIGIVTIWLLAVAACNTLEGLGKDIKHAGQSIEKAAER